MQRKEREEGEEKGYRRRKVEEREEMRRGKINGRKYGRDEVRRNRER